MTVVATPTSCGACGHLLLMHRSNLDSPTMPLDSPVPCFAVVAEHVDPSRPSGVRYDACGCETPTAGPPPVKAARTPARRFLHVERENGSHAWVPVADVGQLVAAMAGLAPFVPADATWDVTPTDKAPA